MRLDAVPPTALGGGLPRATTTGLIGPPGSGKTSIGLRFIAGATREEPALVFGLNESPASLRAGGAALGLDRARMEREGALHIAWQSQGEHRLDELAHRLLGLVQSTRGRGECSSMVTRPSCRRP